MRRLRRAAPWFILGTLLCSLSFCASLVSGRTGGGASSGPGSSPIVIPWDLDGLGDDDASGDSGWDFGGSDSGSWDWWDNTGDSWDSGGWDSGSDSGSWDFGGDDGGSWDFGGDDGGSWDSGGSDSGSW